MKRIIGLILMAFAGFTQADAQIAYQLSLLNSASGEPRANETVSATVVITNSQDESVYSTTQSATTNDFGILSLVIGDDKTFNNIDTGKFPLFISVTVNGTMIGKSQILTVPVAKFAEKLVSSFTIEDLVGTWECIEEIDEWRYEHFLIFDKEGYMETKGYDSSPQQGHYEREGNTIYFYPDNCNDCGLVILRMKEGILYSSGSKQYTKQSS